MGVNKVVYGGQTVVDMTDATATADTVLAGYTAYGADGERIVGTASAGATLTVNAPAGATVTVTKDGETKTKTAGADGVAVFGGLETGVWTVTITNGTDTATDTVTVTADYTMSMSFTKIYGIYRNITSSSPVWAREDDAVGMTAKASVGRVAGHSDFDSCYPWSGIKRETLSTGDRMVKIPKFWFRRYRLGDIEHIKIANKAIDGFTLHPAFKHAGIEKDCLYVGAYKTSSNNKSVTGASPQVSQSRGTFRDNAKAKGKGWSIIDIAAWSAIQMLILVEYATNDVQSAIGQGNVSSGAAINVGSCDSVPNLTGIPAGTDGRVDVVWRGIEGFWGNVFEWIDGVNYSGAKPYVCNDPSSYADATSANYTLLSYSVSTTSSKFIKQMGLDTANPHIMLPSSVGGSNSTYYCDVYVNGTSWSTCRVGGSYQNSDGGAGLFQFSGNTATTRAYAHTGSRLQYIPQ